MKSQPSSLFLRSRIHYCRTVSEQSQHWVFKRWIIRSGKAVKHINKQDVVIHSMHLCPSFCSFSPPVHGTQIFIYCKLLHWSRMRGSGEKILDCAGVFLASYGFAVVTFSYFQLYQMGLVYCFRWCYMLFISLCVELWKRTNLGYRRTDKSDVKKGLAGQITADFSPRVCVCERWRSKAICLYILFSLPFPVLCLCFKVTTLCFLSLGAKTLSHLWTSTEIGEASVVNWSKTPEKGRSTAGFSIHLP